jgi:hypothetical protein
MIAVGGVRGVATGAAIADEFADAGYNERQPTTCSH